MHSTLDNKYRALILPAAVILLMMILLGACGDATNTISPATAAVKFPTGGSTAPLLSTPAAGATPAASGASAINVSANPCQDTAAPAPAAASGPQPTTTATALADIPNLTYIGSRELKPQDATVQGVLGNLNSPRFEPTLGKYTGDKLTFSASSDTFDKIDAFYRKMLQDAGWQLLKAEQEQQAKQALLVFQKGGSKIVMSIETIDDSANYPPEFKDAIKKGDTLILVSTGKASTATPEATPFAIPGNPTIEVKSGQKKYANIELEKGGKVKIELCPVLAPKTVENFEKLAAKGFYNGLTFHRIEKDPKPFVVQGGDPKGDGTGGPGYQIPDEFTTQKKHLRGTVAMAHSAAPNSAGSQFYICLDEASFLDGKYAIFGQVVEGMELVDQIAKGDKMKSITITVG